MKKSYTIAGVGVCLGKTPGYEALAESVVTGTGIAGKELPDALALAAEEALRHTSRKDLSVMTDSGFENNSLNERLVGKQIVCGSFREMLETAPENALLLSHRENGWLAIALTQENTGFAKVELLDGDESTGGDDFLHFLMSALEVRYALHLDERETLYRFWDAQEERVKEIHCSGVKCIFTEPEKLTKRVYETKTYLLPVVFTTVTEAKQKLTALKNEKSLADAMKKLLPDLEQRNEKTNTIVLLATDRAALAADIDDLLKQADRLTEKGFIWKTVNGSRYICRSCDKPEIVFMNPPASMFNAKAFYKFFFTLYGTMTESSRFETYRLLTGDKGVFLSEYLFDIVVNYCVTALLESIGIKPDVVSGASMGEMANILNHLRYADGIAANTADMLSHLDHALKLMLRNDGIPLNEYLGRTADGFTKFYVKGDADVLCKAAEKYDSVFVPIIGSAEDVILTGERTALRKLIEETNCIANELNETNYIHTPVSAHLAPEIRSGMMKADVHLEDLDYVMFSTHFRKPLDDTSEMLADNVAALLTQTVNYRAAVEALFVRGGRIFIDLSSNQMCGVWASATLKEKQDAAVVSLHSSGEASEMLLNLCASLLAANVSFEYRKLMEKLSFREDIVREEVHTSAVSGEEFMQILQQQILNNEKAFKIFMDAQNKLYEQMLGTPIPAAPAPDAEKTPVKFPNASKTCLYNREQVITMTDTSMAAVLGEKYKEVDQYPVRARMPLPPFLFVSRILSIDAEYGEFRPSSIVTEFDLDEDCVFRTGDTYICPLVASEASHIAIFLIAYMGLDAISKGTLSYRAIDSSMTAYSERPFRVGDTLRTVLKINRFVKNGSTTLLFFTFESYNGDELFSVTEATGGFFTRADLASTKGVIQPKLRMRKKEEAREFPHLSINTRTSYEKQELDAFYRGDYEGCFGVKPRPTRTETYYLAHDLKMVDRVTNIDYNGGVYGRGFICGEKQITPDMWPFKAHFKNDPVFPAIITSDGVTQLGMFLLAHAGLLEKFDNANFTTIKGNCCNSRFRGQVRHGYSTLRYEISVKDVVETDKNILVYLDAAIFNDDVQIMQIDSYALKISDADN